MIFAFLSVIALAASALGFIKFSKITDMLSRLIYPKKVEGVVSQPTPPPVPLKPPGSPKFNRPVPSDKDEFPLTHPNDQKPMKAVIPPGAGNLPAKTSEEAHQESMDFFFPDSAFASDKASQRKKDIDRFNVLFGP